MPIAGDVGPDMATAVPCTGAGCCARDADCAAGQACCGGRCADVTADAAQCGACGAACKSGWLCCAGKCTNPVDNADNCGACGIHCGATAHSTAACSGLACVTAKCDAGWADCNGAFRDGCEMDTQTNADNCGGCGNVCSSPHALSVCEGGACKVDTCVFPFADCNQMAGDGCEASVLADAANCGACGAVCAPANATPDCHLGFCHVGGCNQGYSDCDHFPDNGCEIQTATDLANCGACGAVCAGRNGMASCSGGACKLVCNFGYGDCNKSAADGCEANLTNDKNNCLVCGNACALAHATPTCTNARCQIAQCDLGWNDCNNNGSDGCETPTTADAQNCGGCGLVCSGNHVAQPACANGLCAGACDMNFADCNKNKLTDGCETNLTTDNANCGACGTACNNGQTCVAGACANTNFPNSNIIDSPGGTQINQWIGSPNQQWRLCYQKSRDGGSSNTFHQKCDGLGPSVSVAKLSTNSVVGGYAAASWNGNQGYYGDSNNFLFSLTNNYRHSWYQYGYYQYSQVGQGPSWGGGHDWMTNADMNSGYCNLGHSFQCRVGSYGSAQCQNDFCGTYNGWTVTEYEVWVH